MSDGESLGEPDQVKSVTSGHGDRSQTRNSSASSAQQAGSMLPTSERVPGHAGGRQQDSALLLMRGMSRKGNGEGSRGSNVNFNKQRKCS